MLQYECEESPFWNMYLKNWVNLTKQGSRTKGCDGTS